MALIAGCYHPRSPGDCTITCDVANPDDCPSGFKCGGDGLCFTSGTTVCSDRAADASTDVAPSDTLSPNAICAGRPEGLLPNVCFDPPPIAQTLGSTFDTSDASKCDKVDRGVCVVVVAPTGVTTNLVVTGSRPLAL